MTKIQIAMWMSYLAFRIAVVLLGFILGLFVAQKIWGRFSKRFILAREQNSELSQQVNGFVQENRDLSSSLQSHRLVAEKLNFDWRKLNSIDSPAGMALKKFGIRDAQHLASLTTEQRDIVTRDLERQGIKFDWLSFDKEVAELHPSAVLLDTGTSKSSDAMAGSTNANRTISTNRTKSDTIDSLPKNEAFAKSSPKDQTKGVPFEIPPTDGESVNWSQVIKGDPKIAEEFSRLGIKNIQQLESLSAEDRRALQNEMSSKGVQFNWDWLANWKTAAGVAGIAAAGIVSQPAFKSDDETSSKERSDAAAKKSTEQEPAIESDKKRTRWRGIRLAPAAGNRIDWSKFGSTDGRLARELGLLGFTHQNQLTSLSESDRHQLDQRLHEKGLPLDWKRLSLADQQAEVVDSAIAGKIENTDKRSSDSPGIRVTSSGSARVTPDDFQRARDNATNDGIPVLFTNVPEWRDDLTLLDGIDFDQSIALRKMGIYNFQQLHNLLPEDQDKINDWFRQKGWYLNMDQWRIASEGNTLYPSTTDIEQKAYEIYCFRQEHDLWGDQRTDWDQAEWDLRGNPSYGYGVPHDVEDFASTRHGITVEARDELYRMGLYNIHQVNLLDKDARLKLTRWFAGPRFGIDLTKEFGWLSTLMPAPSESDFGQCYDSRPDQIDDLSLINGVGPATESDLNRIGIYRFSQIAAWTEKHIESISEVLELGDRIARDRWVDQAKRL